MPENNNAPNKELGARIKNLREQWKQTINEVSTTLEIDETQLKKIEAGKILPNEELLDLIINHFHLSEAQAEELRNLASFHPGPTPAPEGLVGSMEEMLMKQIVMYIPVDNRIVYTDTMNATVNRHGMVLQFKQSQNGKNVTVSQVGMSREHAEKMLKVIETTLKKYDSSQETKLLPAPENPNNKNQN